MSSAALLPFPILKLNEIVLCLSDLDIHITTENIKKPDTCDYKQLYEIILNSVTGIYRDDLRQHEFNAIHLLSHPELHDDDVEMTIIHHILQMMITAGITDATMRDIIEPEYQRTRRILSGLINFMKYREDKREAFEQLADQSERYIQQEQIQEQEINNKKAQLQQHSEQYQNELRQEKELNEDIAALQEQISEYTKQHKFIMAAITSKKQESAALAQSVSESQAQVSALEQENTQLSAQIVHNPEQLKLHILEMTQQMTTLKQELSKNNRLYREASQRLQGLNGVETKLKKRLASMMEIANIEARISGLNTQHSEYQQQIITLNQQLIQLKQQIEAVHVKLNSLQDKTGQLKKNFERKKMEATLVLQELSRDQLIQQEAGHITQQQVEDGVRVMEGLKRELKELKLLNEGKQRVLKNRGMKLEQAIQSWHGKLIQVMATIDQPHAPSTPRQYSRELEHGE